MVYRDMSEKTRIQFRRSEIVEKDTIYAAAPEIYAALIGQGLVNDDNYKEIMKKSVN